MMMKIERIDKGLKMDNCEKLLRAFIEAQGYEVEEAVTHKEYINVLKGNLFCDDIEQKCVEEIIDYKVTKKKVVKRGGRGSSKRTIEQVELELLRRDLSAHIQLVINDMDIDCGRHGNERVVNALVDKVMIGVMRGKS